MCKWIWLRAFKSATKHHHSQRGCNTVPRWGIKNFLFLPLYLVKRGLILPRQEIFSDSQLWQTIVLQPLKLWWYKYSITFESPKPYLFPYYLRNRIPVLLSYVILSQNNPISIVLTVLLQYIVDLETWSTLKHSLRKKTSVGKDSRP